MREKDELKMGWRKSYQIEKELSERETKYENQTDLMKNIVQTESGEIVEIINGQLVFKKTEANWSTLMEWLKEENPFFEVTIKVHGYLVSIDFPELVPTHKMESLLEHFTYQK